VPVGVVTNAQMFGRGEQWLGLITRIWRLRRE
jgi:hypothetical protein